MLRPGVLAFTGARGTEAAGQEPCGGEPTGGDGTSPAPGVTGLAHEAGFKGHSKQSEKNILYIYIYAYYIYIYAHGPMDSWMKASKE